MSDSFFTARNQVDPQISNSPTFFCDELIEAAARRIAKVEGPLEASRRLQRIADICSGAYVLPIEHWTQKPAPENAAASATEPSERRRWRIWKIILDNPAIVFWAGFFAGVSWEALWS